MPVHLRPLDLAIVAAYLVAITLFGLRFREKKGAAKTAGANDPARSLKSYFLANNTIPWWAIALSIVSAETSTLTIISIPGVAFAGDFGFLQVVIGYMLGRIVVAVLFLPRYFNGEMLTAYQLIDQRFGPFLHKVTAGLFLLTRAAAEGVRVFAVSIVVGIAIGTRDVLSIGIISALTLLYTFEGGMAAVIWTDVVQMAIYIGGTLVAIWSLGQHIGAGNSAIAGWSTIHTVAGAAGKFHMLNFAFNLTTTYTFWAGVLGGTFLTMASHGTDQLMVQRMLAARSLRESRLALLSSGVVIFIQFTLFLLIGAGLYVFYGAGNTTGAPFMTGLHPGMSGIAGASAIHGLAPDRIFPTFIVRELPIGIAGLLVAAILAAAMSNLSAALNSLSSTTVVDFYMHLRPQAAASTPSASRERNLISKSSTVLWAIVLFAIAVYSLSVGGKGHVVEIGLSIASVAYGCLLGVFLLGTLTKFATEIGTAIGMLCGFALNLWLWQGTFPKTILSGDPYACETFHTYRLTCVPTPGITIPHIAFTWYVLIGAIVTFAIGALASLIFRKQSRRTALTSAASLLLLFLLSFQNGICFSAAAQSPAATPSRPSALNPGPPNFTPITTLLNEAIAAHKLPGAVVIIGHANKVVFEQAYGNRKLAGEPGPIPGPDGKPDLRPEPMTEDTIFDMASLTKDLATATAIMQLYEQGKITSFDDPLEKYLPEFAASNPSSPPTANPASFATSSNPASGTSANGAAISQPSPKGWVTAQEKSRAEGPTQNAHTFDKSKVTLRMLLTHTSGEAPDISLKDPWGLAAPDREEGFRRALASPLKDAPGTTFTYSDINFILLGYLVETLSGQSEDVYTREHIFQPLGMTETGYLPVAKACGPHRIIGAAIAWEPLPAHTRILTKCPAGTWSTSLLERVAPTTHDDESKANPSANPHFDMLTRATVHDPTTRRMGGVAGHAGVFSTAHDISLYASALLEKLLHNTGPFPLKQSTLQLMTSPEQPDPAIAGTVTNSGAPYLDSEMWASKGAAQLKAANTANQVAIASERETAGAPFIAGPHPAMSGVAGAAPATALPGLAPAYPAIKNQNLRGFGWDIDTAFSKPRGLIFPIGSFGHTGFTGTSLWMDPASNTYVILLANAIHPRGNPPISNLRGQVATAAARALGLDNQAALKGTGFSPSVTSPPQTGALAPEGATAANPNPLTPHLSPAERKARITTIKAELHSESSGCDWACPTLTGIDVLEATHFAALACNQTGQLATGKLETGNQPPSSYLTPSPLTPVQTPPSSTCHKNLALFTNQSGLDAQGRRTIDILHALPSTVFSLLSVFTPEHGLSAQQDTTHQLAEKDDATHLPVISLYGAHESDRRPTHAQLANLDAVIIDLQDAAGVHFWTYEAAMGYFLEAAAIERIDYHHDLEIIVLDRPNPVGGLAVQGPVSDPGRESYINYMPLPVRNGLTFGELARYIVATRHLPETPQQLKCMEPCVYDPNARGLPVHLTVVPMQHWQRSMFFADTGLPWVNPSPNLRSPEAALRYPALGLIETTNISVGRGTAQPFSFFGAGIPPTKPATSSATGGLVDSTSPSTPGGPLIAGPHPAMGGGPPSAPVAWFHAADVANYLTARHIPGVTFAPTSETIAEDANHYPFHGQTIEAVRVTLTDPIVADTPELGIEILAALHHLYPTQFNLARAMPLVCNQATMDALTHGDDPRSIAATWQPALTAFRTATKPYLLY